ncbi:MAG: anaerobic ribonucleoside-triphosphate reductase [Patescibacteria group bacterium]
MTNVNGKKLIDHCSFCGSKNIDHITRVTGYFSKDSMWNKGKIAELRDREKEMNRKYFSSCS